MSAGRFPDDRINAFVDGEAAPDEREWLFRQSRHDRALQRRIAEAHELKAMLRHAYDVSPAAPPRRATVPAVRVAAAMLLAAGLASWLAFEWRDGAVTASGATPTATAPRAMPGVVIQVADRDPVKWKLALDQAAEVAAYSEGRVFDVVVIAYGPGLAMLHDGSPVASAISVSQRRGIRFVACGNTMVTDHVAARDLLAGVSIARAGATIEILALQRAGYAYVRI